MFGINKTSKHTDRTIVTINKDECSAILKSKEGKISIECNGRPTSRDVNSLQPTQILNVMNEQDFWEGLDGETKYYILKNLKNRIKTAKRLGTYKNNSEELKALKELEKKVEELSKDNDLIEVEQKRQQTRVDNNQKADKLYEKLNLPDDKLRQLLINGTLTVNTDEDGKQHFKKQYSINDISEEEIKRLMTEEEWYNELSCKDKTKVITNIQNRLIAVKESDLSEIDKMNHDELKKYCKELNKKAEIRGTIIHRLTKDEINKNSFEVNGVVINFDGEENADIFLDNLNKQLEGKGITNEEDKKIFLENAKQQLNEIKKQYTVLERTCIALNIGTPEGGTNVVLNELGYKSNAIIGEEQEEQEEEREEEHEEESSTNEMVESLKQTLKRTQLEQDKIIEALQRTQENLTKTHGYLETFNETLNRSYITMNDLELLNRTGRSQNTSGQDVNNELKSISDQLKKAEEQLKEKQDIIEKLEKQNNDLKEQIEQIKKEKEDEKKRGEWREQGYNVIASNYYSQFEAELIKQLSAANLEDLESHARGFDIKMLNMTNSINKFTKSKISKNIREYISNDKSLQLKDRQALIADIKLLLVAIKQMEQFHDISLFMKTRDTLLFKIEQLEQQNQQQQQQIEQFQQQDNNVQHDQQVVDNLNAQIRQLQQQVNESQQREQQANIINKQLQIQNIHVNNEKGQIQQQLDQLREEFGQLQQQNNQQALNNANLLQQNLQLQAQNDQANNTNAVSQQQITRLQQQNQQLQREAEQLRHEKEQLNIKRGNLNNRITELTARNQELQNNQNRRPLQQQQEDNNAKRMNGTLQQILNNQEAFNNALARIQTVEQLQQSYNELQQERDGLLRDRDALRQQLNKCENKCKMYKQQADLQVAAADVAKETNINLRTQIEMLKRQYNSNLLGRHK